LFQKSYFKKFISEIMKHLFWNIFKSHNSKITFTKNKMMIFEDYESTPKNYRGRRRKSFGSKTM